ncbi:protein translocase subunit SecF [Lawsonia intracellularis]|uniref:protein translocase subunit SecF n=1 Tax=Lawsonia intracellularis TaxID=29546 RepID=UPI00097898D2|nr:protein translocase subunit SecF [Lawsonia intracellularis]KAA0204964.1 protein translocase subunit SecF [Lawsonia intracellularis]OMQ06108.1 protein-export membrane protein SecF [Lawsonia intracellularis]RBN34052.1 protein translocase subunit SecF [Lawsonia intracellularis]UYH52974.1 protein translocase subunit SecF [Lawsonia intracellularis]
MTIELFQRQTHINFVAKRHLAYIISIIFILIGIGTIIVNGGVRYGVDFAGGIAVQLQFSQPIEDEHIKEALTKLNLPGLTIQQFGEDNKAYLVRFSSSEFNSMTIKSDISTILHTYSPSNPVTIQRLEVVGPKVGADLRNSALEAIFYAILLITIYISGRFEHRWIIAAGITGVLAAAMYCMNLFDFSMVTKVVIALILTILLCWKLKLNFALGAIVGLLHDVLITVGLLTLMGKEFDLNVIAALLTLVGYSLNDTIIVYDRIRENLQEQKQKNYLPLSNIINLSINQTLGRTIMTSFTTFVTAFSLFILGGTVIHDFALTMIIGIIIGTFSSIFVASPILLIFGDTQQYIQHTTTPIYTRPGENGIV